MPKKWDGVSPCETCGGIKRRSPKGYVYCTGCIKTHRDNNKERILQRDREYHYRNRDKRIADMREYVKNNKDKIAEYNRSDERKARLKEWAKEGNTGTRHPDYSVWQSAKSRCFNPNSHKYPTHGGRGITMHPPWVESFERFIADVGERPEPRHLYSIDRYPDNNGNYEPGNVRWATAKEQGNNTRRNLPYRQGIPDSTVVMYEGSPKTISELSLHTGIDLEVVRHRYGFFGDVKRVIDPPTRMYRYVYNGHRYSMAELVLISGLSYSCVRWRIANGWSVEDAIEKGE